MLQLIIQLADSKINIETFVNLLINNEYKTIDEVEISKYLDSLDNEDKSTIIFLILYFIGKLKFDSITNYTTEFFNSILDEIDNDLNDEVIWHLKNKEVLVFSINDVYFLINNNSDSFKLDLPNEIKEKTLFCLNCNHELYFDKSISLEPFEFYILTK